MIAEARAALKAKPNHAFWSRGVMPHTLFPEAPPVAAAEQKYWTRNVCVGCFMGDVFCDGFMKQRPWWTDGERGGWGIASVGESPTDLGSSRRQAAPAAARAARGPSPAD